MIHWRLRHSRAESCAKLSRQYNDITTHEHGTFQCIPAFVVRLWCFLLCFFLPSDDLRVWLTSHCSAAATSDPVGCKPRDSSQLSAVIQESYTVLLTTSNIRQHSADIICGRPPAELKIGTPVTPVLGNVYTDFLSSVVFFAFQLGACTGWMDKTCNVTY